MESENGKSSAEKTIEKSLGIMLYLRSSLRSWTPGTSKSHLETIVFMANTEKVSAADIGGQLLRSKRLWEGEPGVISRDGHEPGKL